MRKSNYYGSLVYGFGVLVMLLMLARSGEATSFAVGGSKGWTVPSDNSLVYNQWAKRMRFQIGDSLLFVYQAGSDSVLRVSKDDYTNCNTDSPLEKYSDGHTEVKFDQSGPYYFISGVKDNCLKNEKLVVVVLADRSNKSLSTVQSPSPSPLATPALTPAALATNPSSPPTTQASPPTTTDTAPAPSAVSPPPNGAPSLAVMSFVGSLGAFVCSTVVFITF